MLYICCIYAVSQRVFGYYNWHSSPLKAHTTHSAVSVVAVAAVLVTTTKYNHKANFETKGKSRHSKKIYCTLR